MFLGSSELPFTLDMIDFVMWKCAPLRYDAKLPSTGHYWKCETQLANAAS